MKNGYFYKELLLQGIFVKEMKITAFLQRLGGLLIIYEKASVRQFNKK